MSAMTAYSPAFDAAARNEAVPERKSRLRRFVDRMIEARMRRAEEFTRQHSHLVPCQLAEQAGWKITERSEASLPFIR